LEIDLHLLLTRPLSLVWSHLPHHLWVCPSILTRDPLEIDLLFQCSEEVFSKNDNPLSELPVDERPHESEEQIKEPWCVDQEEFVDPVGIVALIEKEELSKIRKEFLIVRELEMCEVIDENALSTGRRGKRRSQSRRRREK
jgi:hypothetical protein